MIAILSLLAAAPSVTMHSRWAVVDRPGRCDALARSVRRAPKDGPQAIAGFAFSTGAAGPWGRFQARLSRIPRDGASVVLTVGRQSFLLVRQGGHAWSRNGVQDRAIQSAARSGGALRIESRDRAGRRFADSYALDGVATAIDAAAARCASGQKR